MQIGLFGGNRVFLLSLFCRTITLTQIIFYSQITQVIMSYDKELNGLMNYMGTDYLQMTGEENGLIGYKGVNNPRHRNN